MTQANSNPKQASSPEKSPEKNALGKTQVFFFVANLGQAGKSTNCKMLVHYMKETLQKKPIVLDLDIMNPNVGRSYTPDFVKAWGAPLLDRTASKSVNRFRRSAPAAVSAGGGSDDEKIAAILSKPLTFGSTDFDLKFLELTSFSRDVIVNVGGNSYMAFCNFLSSIDADKSEDFDLNICWVTNGSKDCLELFSKTQHRFQGAKFLLTFNEGNTLVVKEWDNYCLSQEIAKLDEEGKIKLASMPYVGGDEDFWHQKQNQPYSEWLTDKEISEHRRRALKVWIDSCVLSIEESKILEEIR